MHSAKIGTVVVLMVAPLGCGDDGGGSGPATGGTTANATTVETDATDGSGTIDPSGEGSSSSGEPLPVVDFEADVQPVINANCTCHLAGPSGTMTATTLNMNPGNAHTNTVGVPSIQSTLSIVEPGSLEQSYLWQKLSDAHLEVGGIGTAMPPTLPLADEGRTIIQAWIVSGAAP